MRLPCPFPLPTDCALKCPEKNAGDQPLPSADAAYTTLENCTEKGVWMHALDESIQEEVIIVKNGCGTISRLSSVEGKRDRKKYTNTINLIRKKVYKPVSAPSSLEKKSIC